MNTQVSIVNVEKYIFTPLKNYIRTADISSTKLPVTYLTIAPWKGANLNIHRYKIIDNTLKFGEIPISRNFTPFLI